MNSVIARVQKSGTSIIGVFLILTMLYPFATPVEVHAQEAAGAAADVATCLGAGAAAASGGAATQAALTIPVSDYNLQILQGSTVSKECFLDAIAVLLRETLIRKITSSIVNWINSGFEGSPSFVTNMEQFLLDTADEAFGSYIYNNTNFAHLCAPFQYDIRFAIALNYSTSQYRPQCTLSQIVDNVENAIDDLSVEWDWDVYETIATDPQGNIFTSFLAEQERADAFITYEVQESRADVARGNGFISFEKCESVAESRNSYNDDSSTAAAQVEQRCEIVTPGTVIRETLQNTIDVDFEKLALADEINEIIGALIGQLATQAFNGGDGIRGLSQRQGSSQSFLTQYQQDAAQATQSFGSETSNRLAQDSNARISAYVTTQSRNLETLFEAEPVISEVLACYESKYNTWLNTSGEVIANSQVENVPLADRVRAWFIKIGIEGSPFQRGGIYYDLLSSAQAEAKVNEYRTLLTRVQTDIAETQAGIDSARQAAAASAAAQAQLSNTTDPREIQDLYSGYSLSASAVVNPDLALASEQNINAYLDLGLNGAINYTGTGSERVGGAIQDLASCRAFTETITPQS